MNCTNTRHGTALSALIILVAGSCASVKVVPVGDHDKYTEGLRFYRPRPYVAVKEPFVIGGGEIFLPGEVSGNEIVNIDISHVPPDMRRAFGFYAKNTRFAVDAGRVVEPAPTPSPSDDLRTHSGAPVPSGGSGNVTTLEGVLKETGVTPSVLAESIQAFEVKATLPKDTVTSFATPPNIRLGLVPWADGKSDVSKFVAVNLPGDPAVDKAKDLTVKGNGLRSVVANYPNWVVALAFEGKRTGDSADKKYIAVDSGPALSVVGASASGEPKQKTTDIEMKGSGSAKVTASGNPSTNPLVPINKCYDIVYLPDFDEQYAIQVDGGLGTATADISLENGWMLERAGLSIDNRAIGEFIFKQIDKFTDVGAAVLKQRLLPSTGTGQPGLSEHALKALDHRPVLLKAAFLIEAQPGLYPILKPCEKRDACCADNEEERPFYLETPFRPYTVIAWNVVRTTQLELVTTVPSSLPQQGPKLSMEDVKSCLSAGLSLSPTTRPQTPDVKTVNTFRVEELAGNVTLILIVDKTKVDGWLSLLKEEAILKTIRKCLEEAYKLKVSAISAESE